MRFAVLASIHIGRSIPLAIAEHRRLAFSEAFTRTVDAILEAGVDYVFTGHYHQRCREKRLPDGVWVLTPGILEMCDFGERLEKGLYIIDHMLPDERRHHSALQRLFNLVDKDTSAYDEYLDLFPKYMISPPQGEGAEPPPVYIFIEHARSNGA